MANDYTPRQVAIHEAGHFVVACMNGMGVPEQITVEPDVVGATMENQVNVPKNLEGALGYCARKVGAEEQMLESEIRGESLEEKIRTLWGPSMAPLMSAKVVQELVERHRKRRAELAAKLIGFAVAGTAADEEISNGKGRIPEDDLHSARRVGGLIVGENADQLIKQRYSEVRELCKGRYRRAIETVADRLQEKKTLREPELQALWEEVKGLIE